MKPNVRASIAYIAARTLTGRNVSSIYDFENAQYFSITGEVSNVRVNIYDYSSNCFIIGNWTGKSGQFYHYGNLNYFQVTMTGNQFNGYDYGTMTYFQGTVSGNSVTLYDYEDAKYHNYTV
jgi:hypothetical protein